MKLISIISVIILLISKKTSGQNKISENDFLTIIIQGPVKPVESYRIIALKYGFIYSSIGCLADSIDIAKKNLHNDSVCSILDLRNGKSWHDNFQKEAQDLYKKEEKAIMLINEVKITINNIVVSSENSSLEYKMKLLSPDELEFIFYDQSSYKQKLYKREYGKIKVDLKRSMVLLVDKAMHSYEEDF